VDLSEAEVREVQQILIQRGFAIEVDGVLGPRTREALISFQRREGIEATGSISTQTIAALGLSEKIGRQGAAAGQQPATTGQGQSGSAQPSNARQNDRSRQQPSAQQQPSGQPGVTETSAPQNRSSKESGGSATSGVGSKEPAQRSGRNGGATPSTSGQGSSASGSGSPVPAQKP
jgi:peptidoglycan hydrolase-like protein with peptidoglycan-binding domain